jgi:hypothetical protein
MTRVVNTCNFLASPPTVISECHIHSNLSQNARCADTAGRAIWGVGLKPLDCWDFGFGFLWAYGCSSLVFVVGWAGSGLCDGLITQSEEFCRVCVCLILCDRNLHNEPTVGPIFAVASRKRRMYKINHFKIPPTHTQTHTDTQTHRHRHTHTHTQTHTYSILV